MNFFSRVFGFSLRDKEGRTRSPDTLDTTQTDDLLGEEKLAEVVWASGHCFPTTHLRFVSSKSSWGQTHDTLERLKLPSGISSAAQTGWELRTGGQSLSQKLLHIPQKCTSVVRYVPQCSSAHHQMSALALLPSVTWFGKDFLDNRNNSAKERFTALLIFLEKSQFKSKIEGGHQNRAVFKTSCRNATSYVAVILQRSFQHLVGVVTYWPNPRIEIKERIQRGEWIFILS